MAKIAIDARQLRTSTGRYLERLLHYLQQVDHEHKYIVLLKPKDIASWQPTSPNFTAVSCPYEDFSLGEQIGMLRQLNSLKADLIHFGMTQQPVFYRGPVVTTIHDLTAIRFRNPAKNQVVFTFKQQIYKWVIKRVARKSVRILTPTEFVRKDVAVYTKISPDKITVTYESADKIAEAPEAVENLENTSFIFYVGRPQPNKNLKRLIDAFQIVKKQSPDLRLVLAGKTDKAYEQLQEYAKQQGAQDVVFTGFVSEGQLRWLYEHARVYAFPSLSEGFGLPPLEAMHYGLPVVSSNATCLPEVSKDAALYFDPKDINDMAEKIHSVLTSPKLAEELAAKGLKLVKTYSWQRMAEQTLAVYKEVLASKN